MRRPPLATGFAVALILILAATLRLTLRDTETAAPEVTAQKTPIRPSQAAKKAQAAPAPVAAVEPAPPKPKAAEKSPATDAAIGTVRLGINPWGEININGTKYGVAPPLRDIALKPGSYKIEVRNPGFASYVRVIEVKAREEIRIRHQFH